MPVINLPKKYDRFSFAQEENIAYGNQSIEDIFPPVSQDTWESVRLDRTYTITPHSGIMVIVNLNESRTRISYCSENEDPFTQADLLNKEEEQVQELIFRIRVSTSIPYRQNLANRLITLFNDAKGEDPTSLGIAAGSLRNFYNFLRLHPNLKYPTISLTPDYNIYASWRNGQKRVFSVHFLPNGDVRFVIFKPNDRHTERQIRISGIITADILMETVSPHRVSDWILK